MFFDGPVVFSQAVECIGTPLEGGAERGIDFERAAVMDQALSRTPRYDVGTTQCVAEVGSIGV